MDNSKEKLKKAIVEAVESRIPNGKFGVLFSGGVDSSLIAFIAKNAKADFICYSVGLKNSSDLVAAKRAAKLMKLKLKSKRHCLDEAETIIKKTAKVLGSIERSVVHVGVGAVELAVCGLAKKDKVKILFSGLGSEEVFAGYERHKVEDINKECRKGLKAMKKGDLLRDYRISKTEKVKFLTPFLDKDVVKEGLKIPGRRKISKGFKKVILREIAQELGLPKEIAWRKKKAAQYGSGFDKAIGKLAKQNKFKYKKDYLKSLL